MGYNVAGARVSAPYFGAKEFLMKRIIAFIFLLLLLALFACGGGSKSVTSPKPGANDQGSNDGGTINEKLSSVGEIASYLSRSSSVIPDMIQIKTPLEGAELEALASKYGLNVESKSHNWATLRVPNGDLVTAIEKITREQTVYNASVINTYTSRMELPMVKPRTDIKPRMPSFLPTEPGFADVFQDEFWIDGEGNPFVGLGQKIGWDPVSAQGGLDNGLTGDGVVLAIVDAGIYVNPESTGGTIDGVGIHYELQDFPAGTNVTVRLDPASAGYDGTTWTSCLDNPQAISSIESDGYIYRINGEQSLGIAAANIAGPINIGGETTPINVGMAGIAPGVTFMVLKIGTPNLDPEAPEYTFTDSQIAEAINYAVSNGANIVALGMAADVDGVYNGAVQSAVQNARDNNVLVLAATGENFDMEGTYWVPGEVGDEANGTWLFSDPTSGVSTTEFSPAGIDGVLSIGSLGYASNAFVSLFNPANRFNIRPNAIMGYCAYGADVYATGGAYTLMPFNTATDPDPPDYFPALTPGLFVGNQMALGFAMGAAALAYEGILANGDPAGIDDQVAMLMLRGGIEGADTQRILNVNYCSTIANNGGYDNIFPALNVTATLPTSANAVTTGSDFSIEPVIRGGAGLGYEILVDWGDGTTSPSNGDFEPWVPGTIYEKAGGYSQPGLYGLSITARDADGNQVGGFANLLVSNPLTVVPYVTETVDGAPIAGPTPTSPIPLVIGNTYIFHAGVSNLLGLGSETYTWDFGDGTPVNQQNPTYSYSITETHTVKLIVDDGIRPAVEAQFDVLVSAS